jgi:signal transduction histidine kinase
MSHKAALAAMKTEIEVALRDKDITKEEAVELLRSNLEEVERLQALSDGLLALARDGGESQEKATSSLTEILNKAILLTKKNASTKKINVSHDSDQDIKVLVDANGIQELFVIILDNAIKYSDPSTKVLVEASTKGKFAVIKVKDDGPGISESDKDKVFERFYRADASRTKNKVPGYGLGLALAKNIALANDGDISVESRIEVGSTFIVKLPLARS